MKKLFVYFTITLLTIRLLVPTIIFADDTPTDTPTPTPTIAQDTPTPTDTPTDTPTPTPQSDITVDASNSADTATSVDDSANTGNNSIIATDSATPGNPDSTTRNANTTTTGDSISETNVDNNVNTTSINSQIVYKTINIYVDSDGNIDLTEPVTVAEQIASTSSAPSTNVIMNNDYNYATVTNVVDSNADTGNNSSTGNGQQVINTGNAYALVQLLNKVNVTLVNSTIYVITVNIYGTVNGNILLPQLQGANACTSCSVNLNTDNSASVTNDVSNDANTGGNAILTTASGTISTGDANSITNVTNLLNMLLFGASFEHVYINTFGEWNGTFLGWDDTSAATGGTSLSEGSIPDGSNTTLASTPCQECPANTTIANSANVTNTITNAANTGNNSTTGGSGNITTGNAYGYVNLINLINAIFVKSTGFLGFINIFGTLNGDIGGANYFITPTPTPDSQEEDTVVADAVEAPEDSNGILAVSTSNNVGAYVLPGDTVTLYATVKNTGTGKIHDANIHVSLIHNNIEKGAADFPAGDINGGSKVSLSTGLVLSHSIKPGDYIARVTVTGTTADGSSVSDYADSTFVVSGIGYTSASTGDNSGLGGGITAPHIPQKAVLAASNKAENDTNNALYIALGLILLAYLAIRVIRAREQFVLLFTPGNSMKARLNTLRLFLL